jgi:hypothetical protein
MIEITTPSNLILGLSGDVKPTGLDAGWGHARRFLLELDTGRMYVYDTGADAWRQCGIGVGLQSKIAGEENPGSADGSVLRTVPDWQWASIASGGAVVTAAPARLGPILNAGSSATDVSIYDNDTGATNPIITGLSVPADGAVTALSGARCETGIYVDAGAGVLVLYKPMVLDI